MGITRLVLKIIALSLVAVATICTIVAYWDKLVEMTTGGRKHAFDYMSTSEGDTFEDDDEW